MYHLEVADNRLIFDPRSSASFLRTNVDLHPHELNFYMVKLRLTLVRIIFPTSDLNLKAVLTSTHNLVCFEHKSDNLHFYRHKILIIFHRRVNVLC